MSIALSEEKVKTDVLVIGAGAGGLMAAIRAADCGAEVVLCDKGNAKRSGGIFAGNDHFMCYIPGIHEPWQKEAFVRDSMENEIIDEDLIRKYIDLSYDVVQQWESWGINMKTDGHYEFTGHGWPGSTGKMGEPGKTSRSWLHFSDEDLCLKLERQVRKRGVRIMNRVMVTQLLKDPEGGIVGAIGISTRDPKLLVFSVKSVVLNTGAVSGTRLYPYPHLMGYSMAEPGTGDGDIMAYKVGADLQNAELCYRQIALRFGPWAGKGTWIGVLRDVEGNPIAPPYLAKPDPEIGDPAVSNPDAFDHIWRMGRGPVWMDPRGISEKEEKYMRWGFQSEALHALMYWLDKEKINIKENRFEFTVMQPKPNIQPRITANFETSVPGLFAILRAGLSRSSVGGFVAGGEAGGYTRDREDFNLEVHLGTIDEAKRFYEELLDRKGTAFADWREAQWAVWQTMHCYALPPHRTKNTLMAGYNQLKRLRDRAHRTLRAENPHDLYHCLEVLNLLDIGELVLLAVNERKESRGQARRQDYPFTNPMLRKFLVITQKQGAPTFRWEKPRQSLQTTEEI